MRRILDRYQSYFDNYNELLINSNINYVSLQELIEKINKALSGVSTVSLVVSVEIQAYIQQNKYAINEQRIAGSTIKASDERWKSELITFGKILDEEITRPLKPEQLQASFYLATMKRAANFSVPGAGKTAMMYGAFAYLSSKKIRKIRRLLVVSPINAFEAWRTEYIEVFGEKRYLNYMNLKEVKYRNVGNVRVDWGKSDIIVINYEALEGKLTNFKMN